MKQHIKQPNYFGLTSSICSVASGLQWFADRSATGLQSVCNYCRLVCMVCKYALSMIAKTTLQSLYLFPSSKLQNSRISPCAAACLEVVLLTNDNLLINITAFIVDSGGFG